MSQDNAKQQWVVDYGEIQYRLKFIGIELKELTTLFSAHFWDQCDQVFEVKKAPKYLLNSANYLISAAKQGFSLNALNSK